jgi:hypothetical protein
VSTKKGNNPKHLKQTIMTTTKTGTEIFNENNNITFKIVKNEKYGDFRVQTFIDGEWENENDANWNEKQAKEALFVSEKGMTTRHYSATYLGSKTELVKL